MRIAHSVAERVGGTIEIAVVAVDLVAPDDGCGVRPVQWIAQPSLGALSADRGALEKEPDHLEALGMAATVEFVVFELDLGGDAGKCGLDEVVDRPGGDVEKLTQLRRIGGEVERNVQPQPPGDVFPVR
ncbi:hypothetical protein NIIDMKKI_16150 [Mycobacterium kansasii]|uniref:Uncharacterized protein n=1 Tax=Mycobacterium kansasii TaxID=1768 RepID=A0A7G1IAA3_MYCKA|nr:hypothetical protein NIIDMKKI_16150 [Mycobacterium kansasii]